MLSVRPIFLFAIVTLTAYTGICLQPEIYDLPNALPEVKNYEMKWDRNITDEVLKKLMIAVKGLLDDNITFSGFQYYENDNENYINGSISQISLLHLNSYDVVSAKASMSKLQFLTTIELPKISAFGNYYIQLDNNLLTLSGNDCFSVNATGVTASINITLGFIDYIKELVKIDDIVVDINITSVKVQLDQLGGGGEASDALNDLINKALPDVINLEKPNLQSWAKKEFIKASKNLLNQMSLSTLISLIYLLIDE